MTYKGEERRKHIRVFLADGQVRLVSGVLMALVGKVVDISLDGIKFKCNAEFRVGDEVDMEVTLPNGMKFKTPISITHMEMIEGKTGELIYGGKFLRMGDNEKLELGEFIMQRRAEQDDLLHKESE